MAANTALVKLKMLNGLIGSILDENQISLGSLFPKLPQVDTETRSKIEKLLESRNRVKGEIDEGNFDDFSDDLNLANYFLACKKFPESLKYYESALAKNPQSYSALCNKGLCLFKMSRLDDAISCYDDALSTYKNIPEAFFMKGKIMFVQQNFAEAITQFNNALDLEPENLETKYYLGKTLLSSGNTNGSIDTLESIVSNNDHADSLLLLGQIFTKENDPKSLTYLGKLLEISPNHIEAHLLLGKSHVASSNFNEAISQFEAVLDRSPNHIEALLLLGKTHMDIDNFNEATSQFEKILEISPNHVDATNCKISLLEKAGKFDDAVECCDNLAES
ncbi:tetratricopeptide repeat protein, partial [Nitrosarchaeum koreense]|nr:tetratricopeptide repeat protein [Nitrosarchaeum koreense]